MMLPATGLTSCHGVHTRTVLFTGGIRLLVSFRSDTLKIEKFRPPVATHCWAVSWQQAFNPAVVGTACRSGPAVQTVP